MLFYRLPLSAIDEKSWFFQSAESAALGIPHLSSCAFYQKYDKNIQCSEKEIITQANSRKFTRGSEDHASLQFVIFSVPVQFSVNLLSFKKPQL